MLGSSRVFTALPARLLEPFRDLLDGHLGATDGVPLQGGPICLPRPPGSPAHRKPVSFATTSLNAPEPGQAPLGPPGWAEGVW